MRYLYSLLLLLIDALLPIAYLFFKKGKSHEFIKGRYKQSFNQFPIKTKQRLWFHCASLGEFEQVKPVIEVLKKRRDCEIFISFFSPSGYQYSKNYKYIDYVFYLPIDTPKNAKQYISAINPDVVVFVKYEFWYHFLNQLFKRKIPVYLVSAVFRSNQFMFTLLGNWLFKCLSQYQTIFVQDKNSFDLLQSKGILNVKLSGDTRYDKVFANSKNISINDTISAFKGNNKLLILGSSWAAEEDLLFRYLINKSNLDFKILIAPHDISSSHIQQIVEKFKAYNPVLYTKSNSKDFNSSILVLDTIGHLASAYYYAEVAIVGGAFGKGLHNILEPIAFGVPVIFGPNIDKYPEAQLAINYQIAKKIGTLEELEKVLDTWMINSPKEACFRFIENNKGASEMVVNELLSLK